MELLEIADVALGQRSLETPDLCSIRT